MILNFPGGVNMEKRTIYGKQNIKYIDSLPAVCIPTKADDSSAIPAGKVAKGAFLGKSDGTPVYSPISGLFRGIATLGGESFFVVVSDGSFDEEAPYPIETRPLTGLTKKDIIDISRRYAIIDSRSGKPLWKLIAAMGDCRRLVVDCTESDPASAVNYRLCREKAKSIVGGAKVLIQALGALKCVFAFEHSRKNCYNSIADYATDDKLFVPAPMAEKYPYGDRAFMHALYLKTLAPNDTAANHGVFIVGVEAVCALYDAMTTGIPQLGRYISFCDRKNGGSFYVPKGATVRDLINLVGGIKANTVLVENSALSGDIIKTAITDSTRGIIAVVPQSKPRGLCINCGRCIDACPIKLSPKDILSGKKETLKRLCINCGACDFACPAGIPLKTLINQRKEQVDEQ